MKEETAMDKITTDMAEHVCGDLCQHPYGKSQGELDDICDECGMGQYVCNILNEYNRLNNFEKSQCADLLARLGAEQEKHRWIPVEERLPEPGKIVLLTIQHELHAARSVIKSMVMEDGIWKRLGGGKMEDKPLAWMLLLEPYEPPVLSDAGESAGSYADSDTLAPAT